MTEIASPSHNANIIDQMQTTNWSCPSTLSLAHIQSTD